MENKEFNKQLKKLQKNYEVLINRQNQKLDKYENGIYNRFKYPVLTDAHIPLYWRYDLNPSTNPYLMQRLGINAVFNSGAIEWNGKILLIARVEGWDRKSFFAIAESPNGIDNFRFWDYPIDLPLTDDPETNVYDMRLTKHEDGWIYGTFCAERKDNSQPDDQSAAYAACGIVRTKDLLKWERLPDLKTKSSQQRNVVIHPEFVNGKYGFYTRPLTTFSATGSGEGIGWGLCTSMEKPEINEEIIFEKNVYHTIKEGKNGQGPAPVKTGEGWLHLAHGVRNTAAGMRYVLYVFMTALDNPTKIIYSPGGYLISPRGDERIGDVSNVVFSNGWIAKSNGELFIYYGASDTRMNVATTAIQKLINYCKNTPPDGIKSSGSVKQRIALIQRNLELTKKK